MPSLRPTRKKECRPAGAVPSAVTVSVVVDGNVSGEEGSKSNVNPAGSPMGGTPRILSASDGVISEESLPVIVS